MLKCEADVCESEAMWIGPAELPGGAGLVDGVGNLASLGVDELVGILDCMAFGVG